MHLKDWFEKAQKEHFAIGAFNIDTLETLKAVCEAAKVKKSPVIVEFSPGEVKYFGLDNIVDLVNNAKEDYKVPIFLNLDHGHSEQACMEAIGAGSFDEIHFDGSELEFGENLKAAKKIAEEAHKKGALVEGEINKISGSSTISEEELNMEQLKLSYTNVNQALKFVTETGVDIFAPVIGNLHGVFPVQPNLDIALLMNVHQLLGNTFLSLHGGSGIPATQVQEAIQQGGIVKVNINTELRETFRDALEEKLEDAPHEYSFYNISPEIVLSLQEAVESKMDVFGSSGKV